MGDAAKYGRCNIDSVNTTGELVTSNCDNFYQNPPYQWQYQGCVVNDKKGPWGSDKGGVFAMEWTKDFIKVFTWNSGQEPANIASETVDTSTWGLPVAALRSDNCDVDGIFKNQRLVLNIALCGDAVQPNWASCQASTGESLCSTYISRNPEALANAFFKIKDIRVFKAASPSTTTTATTTTVSSTTSATTKASSTTSTTTTASSTTSTTTKASSTTSTTTKGSSTTSATTTASSTSSVTTKGSSTVTTKTSTGTSNTSTSNTSTSNTSTATSSTTVSTSPSSTKASSTQATSNTLSSTASTKTTTSASTSCTSETTSDENNHSATSSFTRTHHSHTRSITSDSSVSTASASDSSSVHASFTRTMKHSSTVELTTSTVYTTRVHTVTKCPPHVPCPSGGYVTTETIPLYTTVCPVTPTTTPAPSATSSSSEEMTTSTVYTTTVRTITKCPPTVHCPTGGYVTTETIPLYTTVCPVTATKTDSHEPTTAVQTNKPAHSQGQTTITTKVTKIYTITSCGPTVTNCPIGKVTTEVSTTTYCPGEQTGVPTGPGAIPVSEVPVPPKSQVPVVFETHTIPQGGRNSTGVYKPTATAPAPCVGPACPPGGSGSSVPTDRIPPVQTPGGNEGCTGSECKPPVVVGGAGKTAFSGLAVMGALVAMIM
ncbi:hypothetical protein JDV02_006620 [Purpureocillium takamizusanense]|uniref:Uncharacterized protein n=1 Tax=Purpureocillium takamizusanense TaxID=2060973 RepID=A0A9Q8QL51_9HYPO|nr:uncharacterized protein JDV02_006620 [Purpureocillium takamizusanense]UNI20542.1 hypothetical protein JDV02_006620 [Purpureocillium takamizusanense]